MKPALKWMSERPKRCSKCGGCLTPNLPASCDCGDRVSDTPRTSTAAMVIRFREGWAGPHDLSSAADSIETLWRAVTASERVYALLSKIKLTSEDVFTLNGLGQALADLEKALEECR